MSKTGKMLIVVIIGVVLASVALVLINTNKNDTQDTPAQTNMPTDEVVGVAPESDKLNEQVEATTITYTDDGFVVKGAVKVGQEITVINVSQRVLDFASDDHPRHTDNAQLNLGTLNPGDSKKFSISKAGTWGFHNHLNAADSGQIIVE